MIPCGAILCRVLLKTELLNIETAHIKQTKNDMF